MKRYTLSLILIVSLLLAGCGPKIKDPLNWEIEDFSFINQEGRDFGLTDLNGKVWIADFVFTNCVTVCLPMTKNMAELQQQLNEKDLNVELVSFSVDPEIDTPEVLTKFANDYHADLSNWHFLTGYSQEYIEEFAFENFKTLVKKPEEDDQVIHGTSFFLVNQNGTIIKEYSGLEFPIEEIIEDVKILTAKE